MVLWIVTQSSDLVIHLLIVKIVMLNGQNYLFYSKQDRDAMFHCGIYFSSCFNSERKPLRYREKAPRVVVNTKL